MVGVVFICCTFVAKIKCHPPYLLLSICLDNTGTRSTLDVLPRYQTDISVCGLLCLISQNYLKKNCTGSLMMIVSVIFKLLQTELS